MSILRMSNPLSIRLKKKKEEWNRVYLTCVRKRMTTTAVVGYEKIAGHQKLVIFFYDQINQVLDAHIHVYLPFDFGWFLSYLSSRLFSLSFIAHSVYKMYQRRGKKENHNCLFLKLK